MDKGVAATLSLQEYESVFTGFRCMKPQCRNCSKVVKEECQLKPCYGIDPNFESFGQKTDECEDWVPLELSDGATCCDYSTDGRFKPCRRPGYITVQRAMENTQALGDCLRFLFVSFIEIARIT